MWLVVINFLVPESSVLAAVRVGQVTVFLETSNRTNIILCSAAFYLYMSEKCDNLKVKPGRQSLENGLSCIFQVCSQNSGLSCTK